MMIEDTDQLVVASNRGPVSWRRDDSGALTPRRGFGGLVTALGGALQEEPGTWVSVALTEDDREIAAAHEGKPFTVDTDGGSFRLRLLDVGGRYDAYYNEVANRLLWFTLHGVWSEPYEPDAIGWMGPWEDAYQPVNRAIAEAVAEAGEGGAEIFLQDYHLTTSPRWVRERLPAAPILHYIHTPWPEPAYLRRLPDAMTREVLGSLLAADVIAFSSPAWCRAFRNCAESLLGARMDGDVVDYDGRRVLVAGFVLGVDAADLESAARSPETRAAAERLDAELDGRRLVLRVDRTDLSKNILRGLLAYELLLERRPEHRGRVLHYAHLNPSRQSVPEYRRYLASCRRVAERIQDRFGEDALRLFVGDDYPTAVAALSRYDVLVANPVMDGTNLVAKEGPTLNQRDGVVILSRRAGAADVLGDAAVLINPYDVEELAEAMHQALRMPRSERAPRAERLRAAARIGSPREWFEAQRATLRRVTAHP